MRSAKSSGIFNTSRFLGGNFGIALAVAVFAATGNVGGDRAFSVGFAAAITVSAALSLAAAIAALALPPKREVAMDQAKAEADAAMAPIMRSRFMTEGSKTPHPGVEAMRQFWDATLDDSSHRSSTIGFLLASGGWKRRMSSRKFPPTPRIERPTSAMEGESRTRAGGRRLRAHLRTEVLGNVILVADRLAVFLQAKHHSDRHATPPPRPLKLPSRSDEHADPSYRNA
jgi:hypothetical protein